MSSIIGIDIGDLYTKAATLDNGVIENLLFDQSNRMNHSYITFKDTGKRLIGSESFNGLKNNIDNTVFSFNSLIHHIFLENNQVDNQDFSNKNLEDDSFIPVKKIGNKEYYLHYIFLAYLELTFKSLNKSIYNDFVFSIPGYFNICDVKFISDSLNLLNYKHQLISQEYAISLDYGFYKSYRQEFVEEKNVLFVNIGYNSSQIFITNFCNSGIKLITNDEIDIGGNHFTNRLYDHINTVIFKKYNYNLNDNPKKKITVLKECERVKKQLSTVTTVNFTIDCLTDEITINEVISRELFNKLTTNIVLEILNSLNQTLSIVDLSLIDNIELLGGGMRIPIIKDSISERVHKELSYTLNAEESVSKGCVIYGAINSSSIKNANYKIERYFSQPVEMFLSHYDKPIIILEKGFNTLPFETSIVIPFNQNFNIKFSSELKDFMSNYNIIIDDNSNPVSDKLEITIRFGLDNQIEIIKYNVKTNTLISMKQIYQSNLDELDKNVILNIIEKTKILENKIDYFYEVVNFLENIYYNNLDLTYLNPDEYTHFNQINEFIKKDIVEVEAHIDNYDQIIKIKKEVESYKKTIQIRSKTFIDMPDFLNDVVKKIDSIQSEKKNSFSNWLNQIKTKTNKFNVVEIKNEISSELEKINHFLYDKPHV
jgi:molecular chaperone DnaK (HSP70)